MAALVPVVASFGSFAIRVLGESEINENTTKFLGNEITIEEATRIISENVTYYVVLVTAKAVCDAIVVSVIGRNLYSMFTKLWAILKPLLKLGLKGFLDGIEKCGKCIQQSIKELYEKGILLHTIRDKVRPKITLPNVLKVLDYIFQFFVTVKDGLCYTAKFQLTKYYLEIMGLIRALCEKNNIDFSKYVPKTDTELQSNENHTETKEKDEPLTHAYEISLVQLLYGTEREIEITREIREINKSIRQERRTHTITIKPGCKEEHIICLPEVGDRDPINIPADLLITIRSKPHPLFKRQGVNLIYTKTISYADSQSGNQIQVPLLSGGTVLVDPKGPVDINTELVIPRYGLPNPDQNGERGQLFIRFNIQSPPKQVYCDNTTIITPIEGNSNYQID